MTQLLVELYLHLPLLYVEMSFINLNLYGDNMKIIKKVLFSAAVILGLTSMNGVANAACRNISFANMIWASANFMAEVD